VSGRDEAEARGADELRSGGSCRPRCASPGDRAGKLQSGTEAFRARTSGSSPGQAGARDYDDVTLARRVESAIFRPAELHALKGSVSVNVSDDVVELRGQVPSPEMIEAFGRAAEAVRGLHNLLHTPDQPPGHSPPSTPAEVRERAEHESGSGFAGSPATRPAPE
jgi:hypothetical protein